MPHLIYLTMKDTNNPVISKPEKWRNTKEHIAEEKKQHNNLQ